MGLSLRSWLKISILNFLLVSVLGIIMRYKIAFSFPFLKQKNLLHAHSHFAFSGWVTQTLFVFMIVFLAKFLSEESLKKYKIILITNLISAYGMLLAFTYEGYGAISITFSTLSVVVTFWFSYHYFMDLKKLPSHPSKPWFNASLLFNILSTAGVGFLAYMMMSRSVQQNWYLGSVYYYLHFQYNGWFFFAAMGILLDWMKDKYPSFTLKPIIFQLFFFACIPAYFLSTLWANLPLWLYIIVVIASVLQAVAWIIFLGQLKKDWRLLKPAQFDIVSLFMLLVGFAFTIKIALQLGSTIPSISQLAFGFRPIVIAYLHLILLAVFSLFLLAFMYLEKGIIVNKKTQIALIVIAKGVFANEFVLLVQGVASFSYTPISYVNEALFAVAVLIFTGILYLLLTQLQEKKN